MISPPSARVFVSSTSDDLQPERRAIERVIHHMRGADFVGMEYFGSRNESALEASLREVDRSQLYVGVIGGRYGSGITELEYLRARECGIPCLIYVKNDDAIPEHCRETDANKREKLIRFKSRISNSFHGHLVTSFAQSDELAVYVAANLHNWLFETVLAPLMVQAAHDHESGKVAAIASTTINAAAMREALGKQDSAIAPSLVQTISAAGVAIMDRFVDGVTALPTDYANRIRNFISEYLGDAHAPVPFGGRGEAFEELDAWADNMDGPPYLLLTTGAAGGKSAVLVHWSRLLLTRTDVEVVFVPISIRFRTNLDSVTFAALAARLARAHGDNVPTDMTASVEQWRNLVADYLRRPLPSGKQLIVIIDGLDEAAWKPGADLFPRDPAPKVKLLVSARLTATNSDWRGILGWERARRLARDMTLPPLSREGIRDVLQRMGFPLADLGDKVTIVNELHRLSQGAPLLVRYFVSDLWARGEAVARLKPEDLPALKPGLEGYFERWWDDQRQLWGAAAPMKEPQVIALLNLFAGALGPLKCEDVLAIAGDNAQLNSWNFRDVLEPIARFLIGDGLAEGYAFSHPRFGMYLRDRMTATERRATDQQFIAWGRATIEALDRGSLDPKSVSPYLLQYYSVHLESANAPPQQFAAILRQGWLDAWRIADGSLSGFLGDVDRAQRILEAAGEEHLGDLVHASLCRASVRSMASGLQPKIIDYLVDNGIWTVAEGIAYARNQSAPDDEVESLVRIGRHAPPDVRAVLDEEALELALRANPEARLRALEKLIRFSANPPIEELIATMKEFPGVLADITVEPVANELANRGDYGTAMRMIEAMWSADDAAVDLTLALMRRHEYRAADEWVSRMSETLPYRFERELMMDALAENDNRSIEFALELAKSSAEEDWHKWIVKAVTTAKWKPGADDRERLVQILVDYWRHPVAIEKVLGRLAPRIPANSLAVLESYLRDHRKSETNPTAWLRFALLCTGEARRRALREAVDMVHRKPPENWILPSALWRHLDGDVSFELAAHISRTAAENASAILGYLLANAADHGNVAAFDPILGTLEPSERLSALGHALQEIAPDRQSALLQRLAALLEAEGTLREVPDQCLPMLSRELVAKLASKSQDIGDHGPFALCAARLDPTLGVVAKRAIDRLPESEGSAYERLSFASRAAVVKSDACRAAAIEIFNETPPHADLEEWVSLAEALIEVLPGKDAAPISNRLFLELSKLEPLPLLRVLDDVHHPAPPAWLSRFDTESLLRQAPNRAAARATLLPLMAPRAQQETADQFLINDMPGRGGTLRRILPYASSRARSGYVDKTIERDGYSGYLAHFGPYIDSEHVVARIWSHVSASSDEETRMGCFIALAPKLLPTWRHDVLSSLAKNRRLLHAFAEHLLLEDIYAQKMHSRYYADVLGCLTRDLTVDLAEQILNAAVEDSGTELDYLLRICAPAIASAGRAVSWRVLTKILGDRILGRGDLLAELGEVGPLLRAIRGENAVTATLLAIERSAQMFP